MVEATSPSDAFSEVEEKALSCLAAGTNLVWVVDPKQRNVTVSKSRDRLRVLGQEAELDTAELLPGWRVSLTGVFPA